MSDFETLENDLGEIYENFKEIGLGSFATVFHAESKKECQKNLKKYVAIKMINKEGLQKEIIEYLNQEIEILQRCHHENIIEFYSQYETKNTIYIVLEECKMDLGVLWDEYFEQQMPEKYVVYIVLQLIEGFKQLHQQLIIHRDIKLENIMVQISDNQLNCLKDQPDAIFQAKFKIADMGISKQLASQTDLAQTYAGSPMTMAPEILASKAYGVEADIFSLGVIMFQLLYGRFPYKNDKNHLEDIKNEAIQFNIDVKVSIQMKNILLKMLKYYPHERLSWIELKKQLQELLQYNSFMFEFADDDSNTSENKEDEEIEIIDTTENNDDKIIEELYNQRKQYLLLTKAYQQIFQQDIIDQFYDYEQYQRCAESIYNRLQSQINQSQYIQLQPYQYLKELINNQDKELFIGQTVQEYKQEQSLLGYLKKSIFGSQSIKTIEKQMNEVRETNLALINNLKDQERDNKQQYLLITLIQIEMFFKKQLHEQEQLDYNLFNIDQDILDEEPQKLQTILEQMFTNILI